MDLIKCHDYFQPEKEKARIHIIGCGSVGSTVAENLARCGIKKMTLWDFDKVESKNVANQMFRGTDVGKLKVDALADILKEVNEECEGELKLEPNGWNGEMLSGYVFLCCDSMKIRRQIVEQHMDNPFIRAMFDFRTRLEDAQHYAADWQDAKMKKDLLASMDFSDEEAMDETQISACGTTLGVAPTVRIICAYGVANFMNFWNEKPIKKMILADAFHFLTDAF